MEQQKKELESKTKKCDIEFITKLHEKYSETADKSLIRLLKCLSFLTIMDINLFLSIYSENFKLLGWITGIESSHAIIATLTVVSAALFFVLCIFSISRICYMTLTNVLGCKIADKKMIPHGLFNPAYQLINFTDEIFIYKKISVINIIWLIINVAIAISHVFIIVYAICFLQAINKCYLFLIILLILNVIIMCSPIKLIINKLIYA